MKALICLIIGMTTVCQTFAHDLSSTKSRFRKMTNTVARANLNAVLLPSTSSFVVIATNLMHRKSYELSVGEMTVARFNSSADGSAQLFFSTKPAAGQRPMRFDPRGKSIRISRMGVPLLETGVSAPEETPGTVAEERAKLMRLGGTGAAEARFLSLATGQRRFKVHLTSVSNGNWTLFVNGLERGVFSVSGGNGEVLFTSTTTNSLRQLDFDPRAQVVDLMHNGELMFTGRLAAKAKNINVATRTVSYFVLPSTGAAMGANASAKIRIHADALRDFSIELEDILAGNYEILVNGVLVGMIEVATTPEGTEGEIAFSMSDDDEGHLPLTFEPQGATFVIRKEGTVYFNGTLQRTTGIGTLNGQMEIRESMRGTGLFPGANGDAELKVDSNRRARFKVEIEDVPVGNYQLWVGGIQRGSIAAKLINGSVEGEIEFSNKTEPGKVLLTFDPRGQTLEIRSTQGIGFSHLFGEGSANGTTDQPLRIEVPLFSSGVSAGTAKAKFKRDNDGEREFELQAQNLPEGSYEIVIGGDVRGTLVVTKTGTGTWGRTEFDDNPDPGEVQLTFDPLGQDIVAT